MQPDRPELRVSRLVNPISLRIVPVASRRRVHPRFFTNRIVLITSHHCLAIRTHIDSHILSTYPTKCGVSSMFDSQTSSCANRFRGLS